MDANPALEDIRKSLEELVEATEETSCPGSVRALTAPILAETVQMDADTALEDI